MKQKRKKSKRNYQPEVTARKHWIVYLFPSLFVIAGIILINGKESSFQAAGLIVTLFGFYQILRKANEKWHITDEYLIMEKGILPWFKKFHEVPVHDIYKTDINKNRLGRYLNLGNLNTRRRTDDCSGFSHSFISNPEHFSEKLQLKLQNHPSSSLNQLYELKEKGAISEKEYNLIKLGHITQQHLSKF